MDTNKRLEELLETLVRIQLSPILEKELSDHKLTKLYKLTGQQSVRQISKDLGMSVGKISAIWQNWEQIGILKKDGKSYKRIV